MRRCLKLLPVFAAVFLHINSKAQLHINEVVPSNSNVISNYDGKYEDWIEIYNSGSAINIGGYGLTDDSTKPFQFVFPSNYIIDANKRVVVFASDHNNGFVADHWELAVSAGSTWQYRAGSPSLDTNWRNPGFNTTGWSSGHGGIGFGDGDDNTIIQPCISLMMRRNFTIPDTSQIMKAVLKIDYDDGFVAYLNGIEIARSNMPGENTRPAWNDLAILSHEARSYQGETSDSIYFDKFLLRKALRNGSNVLAVEVHNSQQNSDDMSSIPYLFFGMKSPGLTFTAKPNWFQVPVKDYFNAAFKLSRNGESVYLFNPAGVIIDKVSYPEIEIDNSYCRIPDGAANWCYSGYPSPDTTNNSSACYTGYTYPPIFTVEGGYYNSARIISLMSQNAGGVIRYTLNGDTPDESDPVYSTPIVISSTTSVRARVFASGLLPGPVVTNTYIINGVTKLSTFSITTDSLNLWDYNNGMYVMGPNASQISPFKGANFWQDWQKSATIEFYDKSKNKVIRFDAEIEIYGNYSRAHAQKSFEIKLKDKFGMNSFQYSFFPDKPYIDEVENIVLRNAGTDWNIVHFRDALMEKLMRPTNINYLAAEPVIAYLNGEYWGVYLLNENHDQHWIEDNFGLKEDEIDFLKEQGSNIYVREGSDTSFWYLYNYATTENPFDNNYLAGIEQKLDIKNYADYFSCETFYGNGDWIGDWTNNIMMWKSRKEGERWKYMLYDLDFGFGLNNPIAENTLSKALNPTEFSYSSEMFQAIIQNPAFRRYFINRYADLMNTVFLPSNINDVMHSFKDSMEFDMSAHFGKWGSNTSIWNSNINSMMNFVNARPAIMKNHIKTQFGLNGVVTLTFNVLPAGAGRIEVSTVIPESYPWTGDYFSGNPVTITAIANPGYTFDHWNSNNIISSGNSNRVVTYDFTMNDVITAHFSGSSVQPAVCVSEFNYNSISTFNSGDWIELHNFSNVALDLTGWILSDGQDNHKFIIPTGTIIPADGYLVIVEDSNNFKEQYPAVTNWIGELEFNLNNNGDQVRLYDNNSSLFISFYYQESSPWPMQADGEGFTCEKLTVLSDHNNGSNWGIGCFGGSPGRRSGQTFAFHPEITGSTTFCLGTSTTLYASVVSNIGSVFQWKKDGVNIPGATDSAYIATQNGVYTVSIGDNGCSVESPSKTVLEVFQQPAPQANGTFRCGEGSIELTASVTDTAFWYDAPNGNLVHTGETLYLSSVNQNVTYYVVNGRNCPSQPVAVSGQVLAVTASPAGTDTMRCGPGSIVLSASDTAMIRWYTAPVGGALLATGSIFTTGVLTHDTIFYVEAGSACPSLRTEVSVIVQTTTPPFVTDAQRCGSGSITLTATTNLPVFWYDESFGGTLMGTGNNLNMPSLMSTDTFYAEANTGCPSARMMAIATVDMIPANPVVRDTISCSPSSFLLSATASEQVRWYDAPIAGNLIHTGSAYITPFLSSTKTYFVENGYTCTSNRVPLKVIFPSLPSTPTATDQSRCGNGSVVLSANSNQQLFWYNSLTGVNPIATGPAFTTPILNNNTTFYVSSGDTCRSMRVPVNAIIYSIPNFNLPVDTIYLQSGQSQAVDAGAGFAGYMWSSGQTTQSLIINSPGVYEITVTDVNGCSATDQVVAFLSTSTRNNMMSGQIGIYPNPAQDFVSIRLNDAPSKLTLSLFDSEGKMIHTETVKTLHGHFNKLLPLSGLASGVYFVQIDGEGYSRKEKLLLGK